MNVLDENFAKTRKYIICSLVVFSLYGIQGFSALAGNREVMYNSGSWTNPLYNKEQFKGVLGLEPFNSGIQVTASTCYSPDAFYQELHSLSSARDISFSIRIVWEFDFSQVESIIDEAFGRMAEEDDFSYVSFMSRQYSWSGWDGDVTIDFTMTYVASQSQLEYVNERVEQILDEITMPGMSNEEMEKAIHDWIVANIAYDTTYEHHSAWAALDLGVTVCQGYALLAEKMLEESGIHSRIILGSAGGSHAWNIVELLSGQWFHLDCTWDDPIPDDPGTVRYNYYNLSDSQIGSDHSWDPSDYPSASSAYSEGICASQEEILVQWDPNETSAVRFFGRSGLNYTFQHSTNLSEWNNGDSYSAGDEIISVCVPVIRDHGFFRVKINE